MIKFENICKSFRSKKVLIDFNLSVQENTLIKITGSNGCGKSTFLKIATGLLRPDSGTVTYSKYKDEIGALIENPAFIENETALYNMKFLFNLKNEFSYEAIELWASRFSLDINSNIPVKKYSVGMRQKLGIIQAIMENQKIIYFDEPTRGLDVDSVNVFYKIIEELKLEGKTIIICSHEKLEKLTFDEEYIIKNGKIIE